MNIKRDKNILSKYIGKILLRSNDNFKWMFKLVSVIDNERLLITQPLDIYPQPRRYKGCEGNFLKDIKEEDLNSFYYNKQDELREPTKEELNLYRNYVRELILLNTNYTNYGNTILQKYLEKTKKV